MRWPWARPEHRASATDALVQAILGAAQGNATGDWRAIAALETAVSLYASAFAVSTVICENARVTAALTPSFLATVARALIRRGEYLAAIEATPARGLELLTAGSWDIRGGPAEDGWFYRCDLFGPSGTVSRTVPSAQVLHMRYAVDPARAWRGLSPLEWANSTGALAGNLEHRLGEEAGAPVGAYLALPRADGVDPDDPDDPLADIRADIRGASGHQVLLETTAAAFGEGRGAAPTTDWKPNRFGANPPPTLDALRSNVSMAILSACGVPVSLATDADGTAQRESWRRFVHGPVAALAAIVGAELGQKLDTEISFRFDNLYAQDLTGRASALGRLVKAQMPLDQAREIAGL